MRSFFPLLSTGGAHVRYAAAAMIESMKKATAHNRRGPKEKAAGRTVSEYLSRVPEPARRTLEKVRTVIRSAVPREAEEVISYGIPAFKHKQVIVWYAAFSDHCSLFPTAKVIEKFKAELGAYTISKGTIQFPVDKPLPTTLVKKLVNARLAKID